jgi:adenylate cyclase
MTEAMGDEPAAELAANFCERLESEAPDYGAEPIKRIGDAVMLRCDRAEDAIRFGLHITHEVGDRHYFPTVRVGMHTGAAIERGGDWYGSTVNLAARVSGEASGSEVLLTEATREAAGSVPGAELRERGRRALRNIAEPVLLYAARPEGDVSENRLPIDPVCRMAVNPERAAGTVIHEGARYHFCSLACLGRFAAAPARFAGGTPQS